MRIEHPLRSAVSLVLYRAPIEVQLIVTRRCNLSCGYCNEANGSSPPVPSDVLRRRIDAAHRLRSVSITMLGGEPLLHPDIVSLVSYANRQCQVSITTNGFLLEPDTVRKLNDAGLSTLQLSIDGLERSSGGYIQKSLRSLRHKLDMVCRLAAFETHATVVLCPETLLGFGRLLGELRQYPIRVSINLVHDANGKTVIQGIPYLDAWQEHFTTSQVFSRLEQQYGANLLRGNPQDWHCRAGERSLYVDEFGEVQYCASQRGRVGCDIEHYDTANAHRHGSQKKGCEQGCSVFCVYRASLVDNSPLRAATQLIRKG